MKRKKNISGFTLIELLVVLSVIAILSTLGYANYRAYSRTKSIDIAKKQIISDLRLAQGWALSGKKPDSECDVLQGYRFERTGATTYRMRAFCITSGADKYVKIGKEIVSLPVNTQFNTGDVTFKTLGEGTTLDSAVVMTISSTIGDISETKTVTVSISGTIE